MLPLFGDANVVGIVLEEDDQLKLKYLTTTITPSWTCAKLTYASCSVSLKKWDDSMSCYVVKAFLAYRFS